MKKTLKKIIKPFYVAALDSISFFPRLLKHRKNDSKTILISRNAKRANAQ